jgi:hypothetical protein
MIDAPAKLPSPPHPHRRNEPLPSQSPKSPVEDPDAPARIAAIMQSPGYRLAEQDIDFLGSDGLRGVRLLLEYLKPELLFEEHAIAHTIVVFGSTRICEPGVAHRNLEALREALGGTPGDAELARRVAVAERILAKSQFYDVSTMGARPSAAKTATNGSTAGPVARNEERLADGGPRAPRRDAPLGQLGLYRLFGQGEFSALRSMAPRRLPCRCNPAA